MSSIDDAPHAPDGVQIQQFLGTHGYDDEMARVIQNDDRQSLHIDWQDLWRWNSDVAEDFLAEPSTVRGWIEHAVQTYDLPVPDEVDDMRVRLFNLPDHETYNVGEWSLGYVENRAAGVRGQVSKRSQKQLFVDVAAFECQRCGTTQTIPQAGDDQLQQPHECEGCERKGPFEFYSAGSQKTPYQQIRLQLPPEQAQGVQNESLDIVVRGDELVDEVLPGDRVIANTTMETKLTSQGNGLSRVTRLTGRANSIEQLESDFEDVDVRKHEDRIEEIASDEPLEQIVESIAPSIYGYHEIKQALAFQLFGGVEKQLPDGTVKRGTPHVLLVGDPGTAKSALLSYATDLAPRSVYASGKQTTAAGLTCAAVRDDFGDSGGWTLEAGAIVEAHNGLAAIDELDKMDDEDQSGLLEAMSEGQVSVSKAGINATLPANATVLAAANPKDGRFNMDGYVAEQLTFDPVLLSRFDLTFIVADAPSKERDEAIADHMTKAARVGQKRARGETEDDYADRVTPTIEPEVLRAYIAYARDIVPVFSDEAMQLFNQQYVSVRSANDDDGPIPTTARMLDAVHRLSEASARIRLSDTVDEVDVRRALSIHRRCLKDVGIDPETGEMDVDIRESGTSKTQRERVRIIRKLVEDLCDKHREGAPKDELRGMAVKAGIRESKFDHELSNMKQSGDLYEVNGGHLRLT